MSYVVSARKYRPQTFQEVVGQEHVGKTLMNALRNDQLAQAFLFCGPRGVGKTTCARILAKTLNCENKTDKTTPCDECNACKSFSENASFNIIELDAASNNSVEHIRSLTDQVRFRPQQGDYTIFIIAEVHMLSTAAFNAFLKTLEEPPPYAVFILATTEKHKIIPTILSRCQIFNFKRIAIPDIVVRLQGIAKEEKIEIEEEGLHVIAQKADGALRDALSIFDKIASSAEGKVSYQDVIDSLNILDYDYYFKIVDFCIKEDMPSVLTLFNDILKNGFEPEIFIQGLSDHFRNLLLAKNEGTRKLLELSEKLQERYVHQAALVSQSYVFNALNLLNSADLSLPRSNQKNLHVEIVLGKIVYQSRLVSTADNTPKKSSRLSPLLTRSQAVSKTITIPQGAAKEHTIEDKEENIETSSPKATPRFSKAPTISSNVADLISKIKKEENVKSANKKALELDVVTEIWENYKERLQSTSIRSAFNQAILAVEKNAIQISVPTGVIKDMIIQEKILVDEFRKNIDNKELIMNVVVDINKFPDYQTIEPKKVLSEREIYSIMVEKNPVVKKLVSKFELKPDK
jgi:DNA polymerase-3 subunit gamma/tau